jgi:hypothetical protein
MIVTEVLLEVTNNEILDIAREVYNKAKTKAAKGTSYIFYYYSVKSEKFLTIIHR